MLMKLKELSSKTRLQREMENDVPRPSRRLLRECPAPTYSSCARRYVCATLEVLTPQGTERLARQTRRYDFRGDKV